MMTASFFVAFAACLGLGVSWKSRGSEERRERIAAALRRAIRDGVVGKA